jgi:hypothetical protein
MPKSKGSGEGKPVHSLVPAIAYAVSVLIISGVALIASFIYTSPNYPQFRKPIEYLGYALLAVICVGLLTKAGFDIYTEFLKSRRDSIGVKLKNLFHRYALPLVLGASLLWILCLFLGISPTESASDFFVKFGTCLRDIVLAVKNLVEKSWNLAGILFLLLLVGFLSLAIGKALIHWATRKKGRLKGMKAARSHTPETGLHSAFDLLPTEKATKLQDLYYRLHGPGFEPGLKCQYPTHVRGSSQCWLKVKWDPNDGGKWVYSEEIIQDVSNSKA